MAVTSTEPIGTRFKAMFKPSTRARDSRRGRVPEESTEVEVLQDLAPTIESLFRPSTRYRDSRRNRRNRRGHLPKGWTEVELLQDLTPEDVLATGISWADFCLFLRNKVVWMTPDVYIRSGYMANTTADPLVLALKADASGSHLRVCVRMGMAAAAATATCDFLLRTLATCEKDGVSIFGNYNVPPPLSGAGLSRFFQDSRSCLRKVTLNSLLLSEDQCLALATMSRLDVELLLFDCSLSNGAAFAFVECLQSDRGPIQLDTCTLDSQILANALIGKSRVTRLRPHSIGTNHTEIAVFFRALANNRGLVALDLSDHGISDESWSILCESLQGHPTLTSLNLMYTRPGWLNDEGRAQSTRVLGEMMQRNTSLLTIEQSTLNYDKQIYAEMVQPYLETNQYRPRVLAITNANIPLRRPFLGLALQAESVRKSSNLLWMFLSANPDVVVLANEDGDQVVESAVTEPVETASSVPADVAAVALSEVAGARKRKS
jgi:hypothetical protein